jgi:2-furoyl-CoA dehydrogenase large subunit
MSTPKTTGPSRIEDAALLTGQGRFLDDMDPLPGTLVAAVVRSPHAHARIKGVHLDVARNHPGVAAVIGPDEVLATLRPFPLSVKAPTPYYPTATDKTRFVGEPVVVVVAADRYAAEDAAELVEIEYEVLPAVVRTDQALEDDAPRLHDRADSNVATDRTFTFGEVDAAFDLAAHTVTGNYSFPRYSSMPMECYCVVADWQDRADGPEVTAWSNFHGPFSMAPVVAGSLGIPTSSLRLIVPADIGGSFGIKSAVYPYIALMALASRYAGRPVRWTEDRLEHLQASSSGSDRLMTFSAAVDDDGVVSALRVDLVDNVGAYLRPPEPSTLYRCFGNITGAYRIDVVEIRARAVVTNKAPTGLNRGFGGQQLYFGLERLIDDIAAELELDPADVRRRNLLNADQFPHATPSGGIYDSGDYHRAFELALENVDYDRLRKEQVVARENGEWMGIGMATIVDPQGVVSVLLGTVPQGQGHATVARDIVAEHLGLPVEQVRPRVEMDTNSTPWTISSGSYSSRFAPLLTSALLEAADGIAATIKLAAGVLLEAEPEALELADGTVRVIDEPSRAVEFKHAAGLVHWDPGSLPEGVSARLYEEAAFTPPQSKAASRTDQINSSLCYGFVAEVVVVRIDPETLRMTIENVSSVHDAGTILNQTLLDGQIHGALAQALGGALYEELTYSDSGQPTAGTFMDYLCPTSAESCFPLVNDHVVTPSPLTRLGAKGSGEGSSMSLPVAIANAVADALAPEGIAINSLPLHGNVLHHLLHQTKGI